MSWNNGYRRKQFEEKQKKQAEEYRALGMTEEQIQAMYEFDLEQFKSDRNYYSHTQSLLPDTFDEDEDNDDKLSIFNLFQDVLTTTIEKSECKSRYWWIEEINNSELYSIVIGLSNEQIELLTLIYVDRLSQSEAARIFNVSQAAISQRLKKINEIFVICL